MEGRKQSLANKYSRRDTEKWGTFLKDSTIAVLVANSCIYKTLVEASELYQFSQQTTYNPLPFIRHEIPKRHVSMKILRESTKILKLLNEYFSKDKLISEICSPHANIADVKEIEIDNENTNISKKKKCHGGKYEK